MMNLDFRLRRLEDARVGAARVGIAAGLPEAVWAQAVDVRAPMPGGCTPAQQVLAATVRAMAQTLETGDAGAPTGAPDGEL